MNLYKKPCYGYVKGEDGELVPNEAQAAIVVHIYDLYLSGQSFAGIIEVLADEGIPSPQGSERWSKKMIENVLTNLKYTGNVASISLTTTYRRIVSGCSSIGNSTIFIRMSS